MGKVMLEGFECERCGHKWIPRAATQDIPTICPKCKSPYWNKPRKTSTVDQAREAMKQKRKKVGDIG